MIFRRKVYDQLLLWKENYADSYAVLLEGARRVGKSTIAEEFAKKEYTSYILIDFANVSSDILSCFDDIASLDLFFLRLQASTGVTLVEHSSLIIFDEVQLFPKARQAIKYLVKDGRYHYLETGSLISIKKNVKGIVIPSEEKKIQVYPMDYEEFQWATQKNSMEMARAFLNQNHPLGQAAHRRMMQDFRLFMAVGGMPQAVKAFIEKKSFAEIDLVKREILALYEDDFRKIDTSGRVSMLFKSIPAQLATSATKFSLSKALRKRKGAQAEKFLYELINSKTVNICYNTTDPLVSLSQTRDLDDFKLYLGDTGLFVTLIFIDKPVAENDLYNKLMIDHLPANLGFLYENAVAQMITASGRELYYHTWAKEGSTHRYEIDFLLSDHTKIMPIEVKSSGLGAHESIRMFYQKNKGHITAPVIISQKDFDPSQEIRNLPVYMVPALLERMI